ncbi:MAG: hypothetical protein RIR16_342 [Actinomycetota bacterium]
MPKDPETKKLIPGSIAPALKVPDWIAAPEYVGKRAPQTWHGGHVRTPAEIEKIRRSAKLAATALEKVSEAIRPGVTTNRLDELGHEFLVANGAYPSTLGYRGFPKSMCTSINEVICHGIPDNTVLEEGDIVNVDITAFFDGFHGDTNATFRVGQVSDEVDALINNTLEATLRGIRSALPGRSVNVIGRTIESYARRFSYGVVRDFTGHGIGQSFHSGLIIPHYDSAPLYDDEIQVGMVFTVEPMLTLGTHEWEMWPDGWTVVTKDRSITAQFEHTVVITEDGPEILTTVES